MSFGFSFKNEMASSLLAWSLLFATAVLSAGTHVSRNLRWRAAYCVLRCVHSHRSHRLRYHQLVLSAMFYFCKESKLIPFGLFTKMRCPLLFCIVVNVRYSGLSAGTHVSRNLRWRAACCLLRFVRSHRSHRLCYHQLVLSAKFYFCKENCLGDRHLKSWALKKP